MFKIIGILTIVYLVIKFLYKYYKKIYPTKITSKNCPQDHDTMCRYGATRCNSCNTIFWEEELDEDE